MLLGYAAHQVGFQPQAPSDFRYSHLLHEKSFSLGLNKKVDERSRIVNHCIRVFGSLKA